MKKHLIYFNLIIITLFYNFSFSQESKNKDIQEKDQNIVEHDSEHFKKHNIAFMLSHTHISTGVEGENDKEQWLVLASFGLDYNYNFNKKWALGLHTHMIIEEFAVKDNTSPNNDMLNRSGQGEVVAIERGRPFSVGLMGIYKIHEHIALLVGGGMEFSSHEDFKVVKFGVEFPFHIPNNWEVFGALSYDINIDAYQSFTFGLGIAKLF